ncbi:MAG: 5'-3'-deoxyribonucleotidase [bacterium]
MIVLVDQDNVLTDFDGSFLIEWRRQFPDEPFVPFERRKAFYVYKDYPTELKEKVVSIYTTAGFVFNLPPLDGALEALTQLVELGHDVRICSSPLSSYKNCVEEKYAWVERHFGKDFVKRIILAKDKTLIRGDVLIDDRPEITGLLNPEWEHIVFDRPWNRAIQRKRLTWQNWRQVLQGA